MAASVTRLCQALVPLLQGVYTENNRQRMADTIRELYFQFESCRARNENEVNAGVRFATDLGMYSFFDRVMYRRLSIDDLINCVREHGQGPVHSRTGVWNLSNLNNTRIAKLCFTVSWYLWRKQLPALPEDCMWVRTLRSAMTHVLFDITPPAATARAPLTQTERDQASGWASVTERIAQAQQQQQQQAQQQHSQPQAAPRQQQASVTTLEQERFALLQLYRDRGLDDDSPLELILQHLEDTSNQAANEPPVETVASARNQTRAATPVTLIETTRAAVNRTRAATPQALIDDIGTPLEIYSDVFDDPFAIYSDDDFADDDQVMAAVAQTTQSAASRPTEGASTQPMDTTADVAQPTVQVPAPLWQALLNMCNGMVSLGSMAAEGIRLISTTTTGDVERTADDHTRQLLQHLEESNQAAADVVARANDFFSQSTAAARARRRGSGPRRVISGRVNTHHRNRRRQQQTTARLEAVAARLQPLVDGPVATTTVVSETTTLLLPPAPSPTPTPESSSAVEPPVPAASTVETPVPAPEPTPEPVVVVEPNVCAICQESLPGGGVTKVPCSHQFHTECMLRWLPLGSNCPLCRRAILQGQLEFI
jgi:Ring finger domain